MISRNKLPLLIYPLISIVLTLFLKTTPLGESFSGHALILTSIIIIIGVRIGVKSPEFAISLVISVLYLYDLIRIHKIIMFGHSFSEIIFGVMVGAIVTLVIYYGLDNKLWKNKDGFKKYKKTELD